MEEALDALGSSSDSSDRSSPPDPLEEALDALSSASHHSEEVSALQEAALDDLHSDAEAIVNIEQSEAIVHVPQAVSEAIEEFHGINAQLES